MRCPTCKTRYGEGVAFCAHDGTALVRDADGDLVGQVLADRYRIVRLIGEGGMGQVWEAQHVNINKRFAIKLLRPEVIGSAQSLQRFRQEAWAASSIGHENIIEIDDFATLPSGQVYLAMELLDGVSLADRMRDGPLSLADGVAIVIAVGRGLAAAHEKGIVHRDMKPENVFLANKGGGQVAKILDFGIAKMSGGDEPSNLTRTGAIFGTPLYMSPEQAKGRPADARADIYSVGVILYELATGRVPFGGDSSVEILTQHISAAPLPPTTLSPERAVPPALEAIILRALAKEPEARFQTMGELVAALEAVAATLPAPSLRGPTPTRRPASLPAPLRAAAATPARPVVATPLPRHAAASGAVAGPNASAAVAAPSASVPAVAQGAAATGTHAPAAAAPAAVAPAAAAPRSRVARNTALALGALVAVGGVAWLAIRPRSQPQPAPRPQPQTQAQPPAPAPPTQPPAHAPPAQPTAHAPAPAQPTAQAETPAPQPATEVIVDSDPPGARILRDGRPVGDTPEALRLAAPTPLTLTKDGYADKRVLADPALSRKLLVHLDRLHPAAAAAHAKPGHHDAKPPAHAASAVVASHDAPSPPPSGARPTPAPAAAPSPPPKSHDAVAARVEHQATLAVPGGHRVGDLYRGTAADKGDRSDWFMHLDAARCYTFLAEGGDGVQGIYLYLWGPNGRRVRDSRVKTPHAQMTYCTQVAGSYHLQAKVSDGHGDYRAGIYTR